MRTFETGATRDDDATKVDFEGFLSPTVLKRFGAYMTEHRFQADGQVRASDNWQKGIPQDVYIKSLFRHFMDLWSFERGVGVSSVKEVEDAACAIMFNIMGWLHEFLKLADPTNGETAYGIPGDLVGVSFVPAEVTYPDLERIVREFDAKTAAGAANPNADAAFLDLRLAEAVAKLPTLSDEDLETEHTRAIENLYMPTMSAYHNAIDEEGERRARGAR